MKVVLSNFAVLQYILFLTRGVHAITFRWLMKYFKKQIWRRRSSKRHESEKNIRNYVGKCKSWRKKKKKGFCGVIKNI